MGIFVKRLASGGCERGVGGMVDIGLCKRFQ